MKLNYLSNLKGALQSDFIDLLVGQPHCALIETRFYQGELTPCEIERRIETSKWPIASSERRSLRALAETERKAQALLQGRYVRWTTSFLYGACEKYGTNYRGDEDTVKKLFSVSEDTLFDVISCYGLLPDECVDHQLHGTGVEAWAHHKQLLGMNPLEYMLSGIHM